jgi:hypothetical protein
MYAFDSQFFHVGIRVLDIEAEMRALSAAQNVEWASLQDRVMNIWTPTEGEIGVPVKITYSVQGPVHMELMAGAPGSIWDAADGPGPHHFGYWIDDVKAETERLLACRWTLVIAADSPANGYGRFTYMRSPGGLLVEPIAVASRPRFERWWAGGSLTDPIE